MTKISPFELDAIEARVNAKGVPFVRAFQRHAREDVKRLLAEVRRLWKENGELRYGLAADGSDRA